MRIRQYPACKTAPLQQVYASEHTHNHAVAFVGLLILAAYLGLAPQTLPSYKQSDKVLHFVTFLLITVLSYIAR